LPKPHNRGHDLPSFPYSRSSISAVPGPALASPGCRRRAPGIADIPVGPGASVAEPVGGRRCTGSCLSSLVADRSCDPRRRGYGWARRPRRPYEIANRASLV
jgi:hypothetical protein